MIDMEIDVRLREHLNQVTKLHGPEYHSPEELLGFLTEEYREEADEIHIARGRYTEAMKRELFDIMVVCWKGLRSC